MLYDAMEERAVVVALTSQLQEVIAMQWGLIVEANGDIAQCGFD